MVNEKKVSSGGKEVPGGLKPIKVIYIIGPIRSKWGLIGRLINVWRGRQAAVRLWKAGFAVICPHLNSFTMQWAIRDEDRLVELDCELVRRCDFVVILKGWRKSVGSNVEVVYCINNNIRRYCTMNGAIACEKG